MTQNEEEGNDDDNQAKEMEGEEKEQGDNEG